jgi:hypothetical protein
MTAPIQRVCLIGSSQGIGVILEAKWQAAVGDQVVT